MWASLANWIPQDDGSDLTVGDLWPTQIAVSLDGAQSVDGAVPLGLELLNDPLSIEGPRYRVTARVQRDAAFGSFLNIGAFLMNPLTLCTWASGSVLTVESGLFLGEQLDLRPEHPVWRTWRVDEMHLRQWELVPDVEWNSFRVEPSSLRTRQIQRTQIWEDEKDAMARAPIAIDYLLNLS
jgi:hypothetical protein